MLKQDAEKTEMLRLALAGRLTDRENFRRLVLRMDGGEEVCFYREAGEGVVEDRIVCEEAEGRAHLSEEEALDRATRLVQDGYRTVIALSYTGDLRIEVRDDGLRMNAVSEEGRAAQMDEAGYLVQVGEADELLKAIELMTEEGQIRADKRRKYEQVNRFVELIRDMLDKSSRSRRVVGLDCGCGKSYLSFVLNYVLREKLKTSCYFFCIDTNPALIEKCRTTQRRLGYANMDFQVSDIAGFQPDEQVDIVCSLHACDTATDEAIGKGMQLEAPFILAVPCCQHELLNQLGDHPLKGMARHGPYKTRLADLLTDTLRTLALEAAGYKVTVLEYVSPIYTPKNLMILAEKIQSRNRMALEQYRELKAMFGVTPSIERYLNAECGLRNAD